MAKILIVDDHPVNREFLVTLLGYQNYGLLEASDGAEALALARSERPDLVISDILMPTMDGYEFVRQLRADPAIASTAVIFFTAQYHKHEAQSLARSCGVGHILTKPCEPELLLRIVEEALGTPLQITEPWQPQNFDHEHLRVITDKLSQTADELGAINLRMSALIDINLQLASERDQQQLLNHVCRAARDLLGAQLALLAVDSKDDGNNVYFVTSGMDTATAAGLSRPSLQHGTVGTAFTQRKVSRLSHIDGNPKAVGLPPDYPPVHSLLVAPIVSLAHVYGWICLTNKVGATGFSEEDERLLSILAAQAGRIYENGSLYLEVQKRAGELEAEILQRKLAQEKVERLNRVYAVLSGINTLIVRVRDRQELFNEACDIAVRHGGFGIAWIGTLDQKTLDVTPVASAGIEARKYLGNMKSSALADHPMGQGVVGQAIRERKPIFSNDLLTETGPGGGRRSEAIRLGFLSRIALPLLVDDDVAGTMVLFAKERNFFTEEELRLLSELASDISFALEHIAKEEKIARLSRIHAVMSRINSLIVRARDRRELFNETCRIAVEHGGFGIAWIGMLNQETLEITPAAYAGVDAVSLFETTSTAARPDPDIPMGQGVVGRSIREKRAVFSNDIAMEPGVGGERRKEAIRRGYRSAISLPLLVEGAAVGILSLFGKEANFFTADELELLEELTGDISFALDHIGKEEKLNYLAYYDALTGLPNRTLLHERLTREVFSAKRDGGKAAVLMLCVKRFRHINETLGRQAGDTVLRELAQRLKRFWPEPDNVARIGGDGFAGIVSNVREVLEVAHLFEKALTDSFDLPFMADGNELTISVAAGIALFPADGDDADTLLRNAEVALKKAKVAGELYLFYEPRMNATVAAALMLENKLKRAREKEQFVLHYQPKVELSTGRIVGLEALIRWNDPETGLVPPAQFIPLLEETGLILDVGRWAIHKALEDYRQWSAQGLQPPRISVNVSPIQLRQKLFVEMVSNTIAESKVTPHGLDLEITESLIMEDIEGNIGKLKALRDMGVNIAIDDFGTGYSSLAYLARLPVNALKIDRSFIVTMTDNSDSMTIVSMIISMAHSLKMIVVAEGVETEEQSRYLKLLKCDEMQGFLFSKPLPAEQLAQLIAESRQS